MKRIIYVLAIVCAGQSLNAQNVFPLPSGNVGIGTTSPQYQLHVAGTSNVETWLQNTGDGFASLSFTSNNQKFMWSKRPVSEGNAFCLFYNNGTAWTYPEFIHVQTNGNIGISTSTPQAKLDVNGNVSLLTDIHRFYINSGAAFDPSIAGIRDNGGDVVMNVKNGGTLYLNRDVSADTHIQSAVGTNSYDIAVFRSNGAVGIGTANTNDGNYKLFVETGIRTRKIKVDQATWPDYVFDNSYTLRPLCEVESFIKKYQHLPEVLSAAEVAKDGIDLGANQAVLLKKVEELTLYLIEQNKQLAEQQKLVQQQQQKLEEQSKRIKLLEQKFGVF